MKRKTLLVMIFVLFLTGLSYAQKEIDNCFNYLKVGDYQRAIEAGKRAVKLYPKNAKAYLCLGEAYSSTGQVDLAIDSLKKAKAYAPKDDELLYKYVMQNLLDNYLKRAIAEKEKQLGRPLTHSEKFDTILDTLAQFYLDMR
jgi:tetratricopeptide (TPR) repeat protein